MMDGGPLMSQKLDYIVFGVPRSGTTAVARYLNCVNEVHCGVECFGYGADHSNIFAPDAFINNPFYPSNESSLKYSRADIAKKGGKIAFFGNKLPKYFYRLQGVVNEIEQPKAILCYRHVEDAANSYTSRAKRDRDAWPEGHVGAYAALDMVLQLYAISQLKNAQVMVVPHAALRADWNATMKEVVQFIAPDLDPVFREDGQRYVEKRRKIEGAKPRTKIKPHDLKVIKRIGGDDIDRVFSNDKPYMLSEIEDQIPELVANLPKAFMKFARNVTAKHPDPKAGDFFNEWKKKAIPAWKMLRAQRQTNENVVQPDASGHPAQKEA